ncbi:MAG: hypothetical protein Q9161_007237 [Pseudevernia consocians]
MFRPPLCLLLFPLPFRALAQTTGKEIPIVEVSDGRIFLPSTANVCSTITTTIGNIVDYIPVPCSDVAHAPIWSEEVVVDGTTAELVIAPSGNIRFVSEAWLDANPPVSTPINSQTQISTNTTANSTSSVFKRSVLSSYLSINSSSGVTAASGGARLTFLTSATQTRLYPLNTSPSSFANSTSTSPWSSYKNTSSASSTSSTLTSTGLSYQTTSPGSVGDSTSMLGGPSLYKLDTTSISAHVTWNSSILGVVPLVTTQSTLLNSASDTLTAWNATSGYSISSVTRIITVGQSFSSSQLSSNSSGSPPSFSTRTISASQSSHEPTSDAPSIPPTAGTSSATTSTYSILVTVPPNTSSFPSIQTITPPSKSSLTASGNFTPPISSDLEAFETSGPSLITLSMSGQSILLIRQTMPGFEDFTGTKTVTTSEATTNSAGVVGWATGAVIIGTDGVFWGLYLGSRGTGGFCIWPFCSGGKGSGICIWPFCGGTGGGGGGGGGGGDSGGDDDSPISTSPKSTTATTTASDPLCPLFSIPSDSLTFDDSPTWNPNDPEFNGDIVTAAYAIWQVDSGSGSEILPPLPASTGSGDVVFIGFIPNAAGDGGNSTNATVSTAIITPMPGVVKSAEVAASEASMASVMSASSPSVASAQSVLSVQNLASVDSAAAAKSVAVVEIIAAIQSQASIDSIASAQSAASVTSVSAASAVGVASAHRVASAISAASALSAASAHRAASALSASSIASLPTPTPNLAIIIIRNDNCDDVDCFSTGYVYDITPSSRTVPVCSNPHSVDSFSYPYDVLNQVGNYFIDTGKFTSHGIYTNCEYEGGSDFIGFFSCDQVEPVLCSVPVVTAEQETSCTSSHDLDADDWVPIVYCEVSHLLQACTRSVPARAQY